MKEIVYQTECKGNKKATKQSEDLKNLVLQKIDEKGL